ncbi:MAG: rod shape-determining protein MreC [Planctomycetales bacterium]|jgi:cell shape-determining protein MreC
MTESQNNSTFRVLAACLLGAAMFAVLPTSATTPIRDIVRLAMSPGQRFVSSTVAAAKSKWQSSIDQKLARQQQQLDKLEGEVANGQLRERRALLAAESATQELAAVERNGASPFSVETARSLIRPRAVRATVLGREILSELKSRRILDRGDTDGVASDLWVLNGDLPIVQVGSEMSVADGLPVFAGRCVVGRIVEAGRWSSSLQYITEPGFRARAVLARVNSNGSAADRFSFGAEGLIEGRSDLKQNGLCELAQIPATEHVDVGMPVYSPPRDAVDAPMLFGHVISAEIPPGALHWVITVSPAVDVKQLRSVEIVVPELSTDFGPDVPAKTFNPTSSDTQVSPRDVTRRSPIEFDSQLSGENPIRIQGGSES